MNSDWSKFRTGYDVFAEKAKGLDIKNLGDSKSLQKMVSKLGSEDGSHILQAYKTIAESINSPTMMGKVTEFQQLNAGRNLASTAGGQGTMGAIKSAVGANALNIGTGVSNATQFTSGLNQLTGIAKGANFLRKLPPAHKEQLLLNNDAMSQFLQTITGLEPIRQSTESQLMSQVPQ
jgi:hypothetical protein